MAVHLKHCKTDNSYSNRSYDLSSEKQALKLCQEHSYKDREARDPLNVTTN